MKAKAGIFMIAMLMLAFTGFGATTADLVQNSNDQIIVDSHIDAVSVVAADAVQIQTLVIAQSNTDTQFISVQDVALKTSSPETLLQPKNSLEVDYFPDGYSWRGNVYNYLEIKNIEYPPSDNSTNLARDCPIASS